MEQFISPADAAAFEHLLQPHQMAEGSDGFKMHERSRVEHNMAAASKVYKNVTFVSLAAWLGIGAAKVSSRVSNDRMHGPPFR
jgi:COP9 signalosome complex subunit 4